MTSSAELAAADLARSGITPEEAEAAGMLVCDNAKEEVYEDFKASAAIVIPYVDPRTSEGFEFEREGEAKPFCRVRYLSGSVLDVVLQKRKNAATTSQKTQACSPTSPKPKT